MAQELENIIAGDDPLASEATGQRLTELVRYIHLQRDRINVTDAELAERATVVKNSLLGPGVYRRMAA
jgi:hypothetical protein